MTIYVIDNHPLMRDAIASVMHRVCPGADVVELERVGAIPLAINLRGEPDLFCLDLKLPDATGIAGVVAIKLLHPDVPIAVYSATPASDMEKACLEAGATIYIEKTASADDLLQALRKLMSKEDASTTDGNKLSKRQRQLIGMLEKGMSNKQIAADLEISEHTVKVHLWRLFRRLGVKSRTQALHHVRTHRLVPGFV